MSLKASISGFGNIRKRLNLWETSFINPRFGEHPDEKRRIYKSFTRKTDGQAWLAQQRVAIETGIWRSPREEEAARIEAVRRAQIEGKTFAEYAERWFAQKGHKPSTATAYRKYYENHLKPHWGDTPLRSISTPLVMEWVAEHLSPGKDGARRKAYELFRSILNDALLDELIESLPCNKRTNQLAQRKTGESARHEAHAISAEELFAVIGHLPEHERLFTLFMGVAGLRLGEARELRRHDLDLENGLVYVSRGVTGEGRKRAVSTPKTAKSRRPIPLAPQIVEAFKEHLETQGKRPQNALVFPSSTGDDWYINESTYRGHLKKACAAAGIPRITAHDLRHTAASLALQVEGVTVKDVMDLLGHTTSHMTMHYAHTYDTQQQRIADGVAAAVLNAPPLNVTPLRKAQ